MKTRLTNNLGFFFNFLLLTGLSALLSPNAIAGDCTVSENQIWSQNDLLNCAGDDHVDNLTINTGATLSLTTPITVEGHVQIDGIVTHPTESVHGVNIMADSMEITQWGRIDVIEKGCTGGSSAANYRARAPQPITKICDYSQMGTGQGGTKPTAGGAGHGGKGGRSSTGYAGGGTYGNADAPDLLGAGGGGSRGSAFGGNGGGLIRLVLQKGLRLHGGLYADGGNGRRDSSFLGAGGSGGSIYVKADFVAGDGTVQAKGGNAAMNEPSWESGGGAGGRIAFEIVHDYSTFFRTLNPQTNTAGGLRTSYWTTNSIPENGAPGTVRPLPENRPTPETEPTIEEAQDQDAQSTTENPTDEAEDPLPDNVTVTEAATTTDEAQLPNEEPAVFVQGQDENQPDAAPEEGLGDTDVIANNNNNTEGEETDNTPAPESDSGDNDPDLDVSQVQNEVPTIDNEQPLDEDDIELVTEENPALPSNDDNLDPGLNDTQNELDPLDNPEVDSETEGNTSKDAENQIVDEFLPEKEEDCPDSNLLELNIVSGECECIKGFIRNPSEKGDECIQEKAADKTPSEPELPTLVQAIEKSDPIQNSTETSTTETSNPSTQNNSAPNQAGGLQLSGTGCLLNPSCTRPSGNGFVTMLLLIATGFGILRRTLWGRNNS